MPPFFRASHLAQNRCLWQPEVDMATKSPLAVVKEKFGDKAKLVEAVSAFTGSELWSPRLNSDRGGTHGLKHISNTKLLRLLATFSAVKEQFGTRDKLIDAVLENEGRSKDTGYRTRLAKYPVPRLFDLYKASKKRSKAAEK
jgi:hypothetical protein